LRVKLQVFLCSAKKSFNYYFTSTVILFCLNVCYVSCMMVDSEMSAECQLLKPVCLRVTVARNLSASWYHGCADIELCGQLQEISVDLFFCSGCLAVWTDTAFHVLLIYLFDRCLLYVLAYKPRILTKF